MEQPAAARQEPLLAGQQPTASVSAPRTGMHSMDRALEVFRVSWRRAAQAQLAVAVVGLLCSLAFFSSVLSLAIAGMVLGITRDATRFPLVLASFTSASKWQTKGIVVAGGKLASLSRLSVLVYVAISVDLGHCVTWLILGGFSFLGRGDFDSSLTSIDLGVAGSMSCLSLSDRPLLIYTPCFYNSSDSSATCKQALWFFILIFFAATGLVVLWVHLVLSLSARGYIMDAMEWLPALPRPKLPPPIMWDSIETVPTTFLASSEGAEAAPSAPGQFRAAPSLGAQDA